MTKSYSCKCGQYKIHARGATCNFCDSEIKLRPKKNIHNHIEILTLMDNVCFKVWKDTNNKRMLSLSNLYRESKICAQLVLEGNASEKTKRKALYEHSR